MSNSETSASASIGFPGLLALIFITLKLTGYISWPWLWVLAPIWIPISIALTFGVLALIVGWIANKF